MSFFKKYSGTTNTKLIRLERLVWVFIYGGLISAVLGYFVENSQGQDGTFMYLGGGIAVLIGIVMIVVRSQLHEPD